jgi:peptidoglycan/LPS O-acetylase OafA/YrhL
MTANGHAPPRAEDSAAGARTTESRTDGFRPDLEGLRGIAVLLVLVYHAGVPGLTGGYVGVDVFFVLSGFLITGLLVRELQRTGTVSLPAFYARRARRLLPAAAVCLLVTVAVSAVVLPPLRVPDVTADGIAAALYASNLRFAFEATDYLRAEGAPSPLLHYWSLGVEEQFYVFWPALLLLATRRAADIVRRVAIVAAVVLGLSLLLSLWLTTANAPWAFYSLPTRAWELGIGALLAVGTARLVQLPSIVTAAAGWIGVALVALSAVVIETSTPFPGTAALLPTVGSGLVILSGMSGSVPILGQLLGYRPLRFLGKISYSLYLWHWPVIVLPAALVATPLPLAVRVGLAILAIPIAAASQRWIEDPIRHGRFIGVVPRRNLAVAGALTAVLVLSSAAIGRTVEDGLAAAASDRGIAGDSIDDYLGPVRPTPSASGPPETPGTSPAPASPAPDLFTGPVPANLLPSLVEAQEDQPRIYDNDCHADQLATAPRDCVYGDPDSETTVVLVGDSHAAQWFPALDRLATDNGWRLLPMTKSACSAADITTYNATLERAYTECDQWRAAVLERIEAEGTDLLILSTSRGQRPIVDGEILDGVAAQEPLQEAVARTIERLRPIVPAIAIIADTPRASVDPPVCLSEHLDDVRACATERSRALDPVWLAAEQSTATSAGATFVDPQPWVCPADPCPVVIARYLVYRDTHHLATPFSTALAPRLQAALPPLPTQP